MIKPKTYWVAECDSCGDRPEADEGGYRIYTDQAEAKAELRDAYEWIITRGGLIYCERGSCRIAGPDCECTNIGNHTSCRFGPCHTPGCPCQFHDEILPELDGQLEIGEVDRG